MVYFYRPIFTPMLSLYDKTCFLSIHYGTDTLIFTDTIWFFVSFGIRQNGPLCVQAPAAAVIAVFGRRV